MGLAKVLLVVVALTYAASWALGLIGSALLHWVIIEYVLEKLVFPVLTPGLVWLISYFQIGYGIGVVFGAMSFIGVLRRLTPW